MSDLPEPIPAATLILMRQCAHDFEVLVVERNASMVFGGGAIVFPGGRIDTADVEFGDKIAPDLPDAAARIAALRETVEEAGILACGTGPTLPDQIDQLRRRSAGGDTFDTLLDELDLSIDLSALSPFARWCPAHPTKRRFDTLFYIAEADGQDFQGPDSDEIVRAFWASPAQLLADERAGRIRLMYPTRKNLERLQLPSVADVFANARRHSVKLIAPWIDEREGEPWLCIPEGLGYPVTAEPLAIARRSSPPPPAR